MKAFNTVFGHVLAQGGPLDVLIARDDADAKASVSAFIEASGCARWTPETWRRRTGWKQWGRC